MTKTRQLGKQSLVSQFTETPHPLRKAQGLVECPACDFYEERCFAARRRTTLSALLAGVSFGCKGADVHYVGEDEPLPELHSLAALVHKRRASYAFEQEFRLVYVLPMSQATSLDVPRDFFRLIPVDPAVFVHQLRFHPAATEAFKAKVCADIEAAGLAIPTRDSDFAGKWSPF